LNRRGTLLLRRAGTLWGVASAAVVGLSRGEHGFRVAVVGGALAADEIVAVVEDLRVHPVAAVLRRFWSEPAGGLAVHGELPVVMVDPDRPPRALQPEMESLREGASPSPEEP
jgi:hypothetical protein